MGCCHCDSQVFGEDDSQNTDRLIFLPRMRLTVSLVASDVSYLKSRELVYRGNGC
jgi:hypothetical protein